MELLVESRPEIRRIEGNLYFVQVEPELHPEPVLAPQAGRSTESAGVSIYGTVLNDGGRLRMWYQAWAGDWQGDSTPLVAYAESDDGISWRRRRLGLVDSNAILPGTPVENVLAMTAARMDFTHAR